MTARPLVRAFSIALGLAALAGAASAQTFEISPFGAWRWGGDLETDDADLFDRDVDVDESFGYGLRLDFGVTPSFQIELSASRQDTELVVEEGLFEGDDVLADIEVDYYHVGALWQATRGQARPYGVVSAGVARLAPDVPGVSAEDRFSLGFGGGVKVFLNEHVGFRFEARGYWTDIDEDSDRDDCCDFGAEDAFVQGEASVGLVVGM